MAARDLPDPVANALEDGGIEGGDERSKVAWERWHQGSTFLRDWLTDASENYDFAACAQWSEEDLQTLREQQRVPLVFDQVRAMISAVSGFEVNTRQEVVYLPREPSVPQPSPMTQIGEGGAPPQPNMPPPMNGQFPPGAPGGMGVPPQQDHSLDESGEADVDTKAAKYFREECDAEDEESEQFRDMLITGLGWIEHRMDYEENPDGMMKVERVDVMEMRYDPSAIRPNLVDRAWDIRGKWWDKDKAKLKWPDADFDSPTPSIYNGQDLDGQPPIDRLAASFYASPGVGEHAQTKKRKVFILEHTWYELEPFYSVVDPQTGDFHDVDPEAHAELQSILKEAGQPPARSTKREKRRFKRVFVHARETLTPEGEEDAPCPDMFHYQAITGHRHRNKNTWFGLVLLMKDPQRWANKWLSQLLHWLNTNVKTGMYYEEGTFDNVGQLEERIAKPGFVQKVNAGYFDKFRKEEPSALPPDLMQLVQHAIASVRTAAGPGLEALGQQTNDQAGVVEMERKKAVMNLLAPFFAAQRQYRKIAGRLTLYFIRKYLSDGRWIRIVGPANAKYVQLAKRDESVKYDIVVDESPSSPNQKEAVFGTLSMIMPALLKEGIPIPPDIVDYIPGLPATLAEKWKQQINQKQNQPAQVDPKHQIEMAKLQQDATSSANQDKIDTGRLQFDHQKLQFEEQERQRQFEIKKLELQVQMAKLGSDEQKHLSELGHKLIMQDKDHRASANEAQITRLHEGDQAERQRQADLEAQARDHEAKTKEGESKKAERDTNGAQLTRAMESIHKVAKSLEKAATAKRVVKRGKGGEWVSEVQS